MFSARTALLRLLAVSCVLGVLGADGTRAADVTPHVVRTPTLLEALDALIPTLDAEAIARGKTEALVATAFEQTPLGEAIDLLREQTDAQLFVNWPALRAAGVDPDTPVTLRAPAMPLHAVLNAVAAQLGAKIDDPRQRPAVEVVDGVLEFSTRGELIGTDELRVYDVRHLLQQTPVFDGGPEFDLSQPSPKREAADRARAADVEALIGLLRGQLGAHEQSCGRPQPVRELNGNLIVRATAEGHALVERVLASLSARMRLPTPRVIQPTLIHPGS